jgi:hypothetical protein
MDSRNQIGDLLERYWKCETSLEEEQALRSYFQGDHIPADMQEAARLFLAGGFQPALRPASFFAAA